MVVISAQETTVPHFSAIRSLRLLTISKAFFRRVRLGGASCSLGPLADPSSSTEPSQPCNVKISPSNKDLSVFITVRNESTATIILKFKPDHSSLVHEKVFRVKILLRDSIYI